MDTAFLLDALRSCLQGVPQTVLLSALSLFCGGILAMLLAAMRLSGTTMLDWLARGYVFVFRGTPLLVQIFIVYYGLSQFRPTLQAMGIWWFFREPFYCAVFSLSLSTAAYTCEILRGGVMAIPHGQIEAGRSIGMSNWTLFRHIVVPLAFRQALPGYGNEVILLIKATSLASLITIPEVTFLAKKLISETYRTTEVFLIAGALYLAINIVCTQGFRALETGLSRDRQRLAPDAATPKETQDA